MIVSSFWVTRKLMQRKTFFIGTRTLWKKSTLEAVTEQGRFSRKKKVLRNAFNMYQSRVFINGCKVRTEIGKETVRIANPHCQRLLKKHILQMITTLLANFTNDFYPSFAIFTPDN